MMRLDRMLSAQGAAARADVKKLARRGLITVDGAAERDPGRIIDPLRSEVVLAGRRIAYSEHVYIMMNKPFGVVSAGRDRRDRTVVDLLPAGLRRPGLFPAGRLDRDTTGLIIITDDGDFAHRLLAPASHVWKHYSAQLDVPADAEDAAAFARGVALPGGLMCLPAKLDFRGRAANAACGYAKENITR
jgi:16S rRNA pseudouridine516 synthase